jgi:hypothetical protein
MSPRINPKGLRDLGTHSFYSAGSSTMNVLPTPSLL